MHTTAKPNRRHRGTWASNFFSNLAFATVLLGGWLTDQGVGGTFAMVLILGAVLLAMALARALVPKELRKHAGDRISSVIGVLLFLASIVIVLLA
jgi:dipeptide/tripeptide permease